MWKLNIQIKTPIHEANAIKKKINSNILLEKKYIFEKLEIKF